MTEQLSDHDDNPLLAAGGLPRFAAIRPEHVEPAVEQLLRTQRDALDGLRGVEEPTTDWLKAFEKIHESVHRVWGPVSHLNSVVSSPELRDAYNHCLPLITEFETELAQDAVLHRRFSALDEHIGSADGTEAQVVRHTLREFRLAGVALPEAEKTKFRELMVKLGELQANFEQNLLDATDAFSHHETDADKLAGIPAIVLDGARKAAREKGLDGWLLALNGPTYLAVVAHADSEELRELYYRAWATRASDQGPEPERRDNAPLIDDILKLRHEASTLLGFNDYAEWSLATKMAGSPDEVIAFLRDLAGRSRERARDELQTLNDFAGRELAPWDVSYYGEKLKEERFELSEEELRAYFPLPRVLEGLFALAEQLFGIRLRAVDAGGEEGQAAVEAGGVAGAAEGAGAAESAEVAEGGTEAAKPAAAAWHESVRYYAISHADGSPLGGLYTDLFARPNKRSGAWMNTCVNRARLNGETQRPVAHLVCNFSPPVDDTPSLLTHNDVVTLFHEFGHSLHHLLTEVEYPSLSGINGVAWDAVELPSQFLENYAWLPEVLKAISGHHETGETLPDEKIATLNGSRTFLSGLAMVRQLEFALFDFELHHAAEPPPVGEVRAVLQRIRDEVAVIQPPEYNRFENTFAHIFAGGYAAGYYSYKWAEVLAADAFAAFEEAGAFDEATAERFRRSILAVGGSRDAMDAFVDFRGREPRLEALLRQSGIQ